MSTTVTELLFTGATTALSSYDSTKINLGTHMAQNTGANFTDNYIGPVSYASIAHPADLGFTTTWPVSYNYSSTVDHVYCFDVSTTSGTRKVALYYYTKTTGVWAYQGYLTLTTFGNTNSQVTKGARVTRDTYSTGTVAVSGTAVTGTSTLFVTNNIAAGARIGFGTTDPTQVTSWYDISSIASDTSITLAVSAPTLASGTLYVIEEIRLYYAMTSSSATAGGLFMAEGLHNGCFTSIGSITVAQATTADKQRALYWLADASTVTNTTAGGLVLGPKTDNSTQYVYVLNGAGSTSASIYKYNVRTALTSITAGKTTAAFAFATGTQTTSSNIVAANALCLATANHGAGSGVASLYISTTLRIYRSALSSITSGNTTFLADFMAETMPGGSNNYFVQSSSIGGFEYIPVVDRFFVPGAANLRSAFTRYDTSSAGYDTLCGVDLKQVDNNGAITSVTPTPNPIGLALIVNGADSGFLYWARNSITAGYDQIYAIPACADWQNNVTTLGYIITPAISTPSCSKFDRVLPIAAKTLGAVSNYTIPTEPYRISARTSGITDNSGGWTLLDDSGSLSSFTGASSIQFKIEFRIFGITLLPARIYGLSLTYDVSDNLPSQLRWSLRDSDVSSGTVGFEQLAAWGSGFPTLTINYYTSSGGTLILTQGSGSTTNGTFQNWTGSSWVAGLGTNAIGNRMRFVPSAGLPSNTTVYCQITTS